MMKTTMQYSLPCSPGNRLSFYSGFPYIDSLSDSQLLDKPTRAWGSSLLPLADVPGCQSHEDLFNLQLPKF